MPLNLSQVETFLAVAKHGSFSAAARFLRRAQSTVSEAIAGLEATLGTQLFDRSHREPRLTQEGEALLLEAQVLYDTALSFQQHGLSLSRGVPRRVTLALGVPQVLITPVLKEFAQTFPYTELEVLTAMDRQASQTVASGAAALAVALTRANYDEGIHFRLMGRAVLCHVALHSHPLAESASVSFSDLRRFRRLALRDYVTGPSTSEYLQSPQTWTFQTYESLLNAALAGIGWATVPRFMVADRLATGVFKELQLQAYPHTDWEASVDLLWSGRRQHNSAEQWLISRLGKFRLDERIASLTARH